MSKIKREELTKAAQELNKVLKLGEEGIPTNSKITNEELSDYLRGTAECLKKGMKIKKSTVTLLLDLEADVPADIKILGKPSNKQTVYAAWNKGETDVQKLYSLVKKQVKESTIKSWIGAWKNKKNLPAGA